MFGIPFSVNSRGLRGPEVHVKKTPGTTRVAMLGDSITFGFGVRDEETLPRRVEDYLKEVRPELNVEVINFGVISYGFEEYPIVMDEQVRLYQPDVVVLQVYYNDVTSPNVLSQAKSVANSSTTNSKEAQEKQSILERTVFDMREFYQQMKDRSRLHQFVHQYLKLIAYKVFSFFGVERRFMIGQGGFRDLEIFVNNEQEWLDGQEQLRQVKQDCEEIGARFMVLIHPAVTVLDSSYEFAVYHERVREFCEQEGISYIDLLDSFKNEDLRPYALNIMDKHPNATLLDREARIIADTIAKLLAE